MSLAILDKPYSISHDLTTFYAKSVGSFLNYGKETVLLMDWEESIDECMKLAKTLRDRHTMRDMQAFKAECKMLMECNTSS